MSGTIHAARPSPPHHRSPSGSRRRAFLLRPTPNRKSRISAPREDQHIRSAEPSRSRSIGSVIPCRRNGDSDPAKVLHRQSSIPDLCHMADLVALEFHNVDIVGAGALAGRRTGTTLTTMSPRKHSEGTDTFPIVVGGKRFHDISSIWYERQQSLHPVGILLKRL